MKLVLLPLLLFTFGHAFAQTPTPSPTPNYPKPVEGDYVINNFKFRSGETLPELNMHYRTIGTLKTDSAGKAQNAVLIGHGTGGAGSSLLNPAFANVLFGPGQLLDTTKYFIILPDGIGHGKSSKPSDGLHAKFPRYTYDDMVAALYEVLTKKLRVNHLRLVMGTSMGGMHTWLWGERYPDFMDALLPLASLPTQISGRNRVWRRVAIDAIRNDAHWKDGKYDQQPQGLRTAQQMLFLMASNPVLRQEQMPTLAQSDTVLDAAVADAVKKSDANDLLYQLEASHDYDPGPALGSIQAQLVAINFADDLINPPELGILEREVKRVPQGRAVVVPVTAQSRGHGTHTVAAVWKVHLSELMRRTDRADEPVRDQ